jgi:hypothetical protein
MIEIRALLDGDCIGYFLLKEEFFLSDVLVDGLGRDEGTEVAAMW